ncbi:MAG: hypothetical protein H0X24_05650 [Ktedonobacterales bacterium]|nr:hypothetical protein [Ktedonobacterales bacterium]
MSNIINLMEYRKRKCMEALMLQIGLPGYCDECGEGIEDLLMAEAEMDDGDAPLLALLAEEAPPIVRSPAVILPFVPRNQAPARRTARSRKK